MDVKVGSWSDPEDTPGLAHFLEHMLFLGTEKYPAEDDYKKYLASHGGSSNAQTSHYSSNIMRLVVYGRESLDELQKMVESKFSDIPNRQRKLTLWDSNLIKPNMTGHMIKSKRINPGKVLKLRFHH